MQLKIEGFKSIDLPYTLRVYGVTDEMFDEMVDEDTKAEVLAGFWIEAQWLWSAPLPNPMRCLDEILSRG